MVLLITVFAYHVFHTYVVDWIHRLGKCTERYRNYVEDNFRSPKSHEFVNFTNRHFNTLQKLKEVKQQLKRN